MTDPSGTMAMKPLSVETPEDSPYHSLSDSGEGIRPENGGQSGSCGGLLPALSEERKNTFITAVYLSIAAVLGMFLRVIIAQLFGEECANPGTVGWLAASSPLCVTKNGESERAGGIVFADLPANTLGSFIMGMMQPGSQLHLPTNVKIAWVAPDSFFQDWNILHVAIMTGFCGSLTTFSSWNSEMVVMMFGTGDVRTQVVSAIFGYIIGMETALGSYVFGKTIATFINHCIYPSNADEEDAAKKRRKEGVYINGELPEFERRYLPELEMEHMIHMVDGIDYLERWRLSTRDARRFNHDLMPTLCEIEKAMLVDERPFSLEAQEAALKAGWDLEALAEWVKCNPRPVPEPPSTSALFTVPVAACLGTIVALALVLGLIFVNDEHAYSVTYRTMIYSGCFAPFGALLRWKLSSLNGTILKWPWIPFGTYCANVLGCIVSITFVALELRVESGHFWIVGTMRAVKVGFCGCVTTVSTFVSEVNKLMKRPSRAYAYILMSLLTTAILASAVYAGIVYVNF